MKFTSRQSRILNGRGDSCQEQSTSGGVRMDRKLQQSTDRYRLIAFHKDSDNDPTSIPGKPRLALPQLDPELLPNAVMA